MQWTQVQEGLEGSLGDLPLRPDTLTSPGDLNWLDLIRAEVVIVLAEHLAKLRLGLKVNHIFHPIWHQATEVNGTKCSFLDILFKPKESFNY